MNVYTLTSDSQHWWWPSAGAGTTALAAISLVFTVPATGHAMPVDYTPTVVPIVALNDDFDASSRPCFMIQPRWNTALNWLPPSCHTDSEPSRVRTFVIRPGLVAGV